MIGAVVPLAMFENKVIINCKKTFNHISIRLCISGLNESFYGK